MGNQSDVKMNLRQQLEKLPFNYGRYNVVIMKKKGGRWIEFCRYNRQYGFFDVVKIGERVESVDQLASEDVEMMWKLDEIGVMKAVLIGTALYMPEDIEFGSVSWWGPDTEIQTECNRELASETTKMPYL